MEIIDYSWKAIGKTYLSLTHLLSSHHLTTLALQKEKEFLNDHKDSYLKGGEFPKKLYYEHQSFVIGSILTSVAFLEATINEFFSDMVRPHPRNKEGETEKLLERMWKLGIPRTAYYPITTKYQIALTLSGKEQIPEDKEQFQSVSLLIKLRNALIHYEPEEIVIKASNQNDVEVHKFEKMFKGKFPLNEIALPEYSVFQYYPYKMLGYGCCNWALHGCLDFTDLFFSLLGEMPRYSDIRPI
jgi:hypothetical protein